MAILFTTTIVGISDDGCDACGAATETWVYSDDLGEVLVFRKEMNCTRASGGESADGFESGIVIDELR
jgi:hypothetical protein